MKNNIIHLYQFYGFITFYLLFEPIVLVERINRKRFQKDVFNSALTNCITAFSRNLSSTVF